jgi:hypothetical protein
MKEAQFIVTRLIAGGGGGGGSGAGPARVSNLIKKYSKNKHEDKVKTYRNTMKDREIKQQ